MKVLETLVIINPEYSEIEIEQIQQEIGAYLQNHSAHTVGISTWGRKKLAYPIGSHREGYYAIFRSCVNDTSEVSNIHSWIAIRMKDVVIKHIVIELDDIDVDDCYWETDGFTAIDLSCVELATPEDCSHDSEQDADAGRTITALEIIFGERKI